LSRFGLKLKKPSKLLNWCEIITRAYLTWSEKGLATYYSSVNITMMC